MSNLSVLPRAVAKLCFGSISSVAAHELERNGESDVASISARALPLSVYVRKYSTLFLPTFSSTHVVLLQDSDYVEHLRARS